VSNFQKCPPFLDFSTKKQKVCKNIFIPTLPFSEQFLIHYIHSRFFSAAKKDYLKKSKNGHFYKCPKMSKIEISWGL
jgi:hypothetical protein